MLPEVHQAAKGCCSCSGLGAVTLAAHTVVKNIVDYANNIFGTFSTVAQSLVASELGRVCSSPCMPMIHHLRQCCMIAAGYHGIFSVHTGEVIESFERGTSPGLIDTACSCLPMSCLLLCPTLQLRITFEMFLLSA